MAVTNYWNSPTEETRAEMKARLEKATQHVTDMTEYGYNHFIECVTDAAMELIEEWLD